MRPAAPLYAVILLQIVLGVFDIASYVVRATSTRSLVSRDALHVGLIVLQFSRDDVPFRFGCCASESPSMSPLSRFGDGDSPGVAARSSRVPRDPPAGAGASVFGACHPGSPLDRSWSVAGNTGCVAGVTRVPVTSSRLRFSSFLMR